MIFTIGKLCFGLGDIILFMMILCLIFATNVASKQALACTYLTSSDSKSLSFILTIMGITLFSLNFVWFKAIFMFFTEPVKMC